MAKKQIEQTEIEAPYELPEGWKWCRLGDVAEKIKRGKSPKYTESSNVMVFAQKCNQPDGTISLEKSLFLDESTLGKYKESDFTKNGDILINSTGTGTIGRVGFFCSEILEKEKRLVPDSHVTTVRIIDDNCSKLFYYFLKEKENYLSMQGVGTTNMKELHIDVLENMPFPLPPTLEEQQRIVNRIETLFAKLDQAKEKAQNVVDTFETRKASILHKAFNNQLKIDNEELKDEDWVEITIGECGDWYGGGTPNTSIEEYWKDGSILWITSKDMKSDYIEDTQLHVTQTGIDNSSAKLIQEPAVLFVMRSGILRRTFPVCMVEKEFTVNQDLKALVPFDNVNLKFLFYYCKAKEKKILNECMKSGTTVESINAQSLMNLKIKLPPINYQLSIVNFLDTILEKETKAEESAEAVLEQIDLLKKSILARAFRGEL